MEPIFGQKSQEGLTLRDPSPYSLIGYTNNNFAKDSKNYKSVISYCFFLNRAIIF